MKIIETQVLVVGGGPVGLSLAGDLGSRRLSCHLVERTDGQIIQPKMDGVNVRTMEFCRRWQLTDAIRNCGYPKNYPQDMVYLTSFDGYELGRESFVTPSGGAEERRQSSSPESRFRCPQNLFDPILKKFALSHPSVQLNYQHSLLTFEDNGSHVTSEIKNEVTGQNLRIMSQYLVGCDGASSTVRKILGINSSGLGILTYATNVLFQCKELAGFGHIRLGYRYLFIGTQGVWATVVAISGADIWRLSIIGSPVKTELTEADIDLALKEILGSNLTYKILSIVPWVRREQLADSYRKGRVFLAGDSAHQTSPTGGFGMNLGIADAVDLSWKIQATIKGWGGEDLLNSYQIERRPVAQRALRESSGNLKRMLSVKPEPRLLEKSLDSARIRYQIGQTYEATMLREWYKLGIDLGYIYSPSPVIVEDSIQTKEHLALLDRDHDASIPPNGYLENGTPITPSLLREWQRLSLHQAMGSVIQTDWQELEPHQVMLYTQSSQPGARAPHVWLSDGRSTLDWFGDGLVLIHINGDSATIQWFEEICEVNQIPFQIHTDTVLELRDRYITALTLVRPDGHVAWRGNTLNKTEIERVISIVRGVI